LCASARVSSTASAFSAHSRARRRASRYFALGSVIHVPPLASPDVEFSHTCVGRGVPRIFRNRFLATVIPSVAGLPARDLRAYAISVRFGDPNDATERSRDLCQDL